MEIKPLKLDLHYPSLDEIGPDIAAARIIAPAYASVHISETAASFQYIYHHLYFDKLKMEEYAYVLESIAIAEMIHLEVLGKLLLNLGVDPIYSANPPQRNYYNTSGVSYSRTPQQMLMDDIRAEMSAISDYQGMLRRLKNEKVAAVIQRIIMDEMLHLEEFKRLLNNLCTNKKE